MITITDIPPVRIYTCPIPPDNALPRTQRERCAVQALVEAALGPGAAPISHRPDGSPYLVSHPHLSISVSHSRHTAALATAPATVCMGIDIEQERVQLAATRSRYANAADRPAHSTPADTAHSHTPPADGTAHSHTSSVNTLLRLWTAKEAAFKAWSPRHPRLHATLADFAVDLTAGTVTTPTGETLTLTHLPVEDELLALATDTHHVINRDTDTTHNINSHT